MKIIEYDFLYDFITQMTIIVQMARLLCIKAKLKVNIKITINQ
jgi:hypothetical protein